MALRKLFLFCFVFLLLVVFPKKIFASDNFTTDYHVIYAVSEDGTTHASLNVSLTNETSDYYVASYKVQLGFENLVNVAASDTGGRIIPVITKTDNGQLLELKFNKNVVGLGNKQTFKITFDTGDITQRQGEVWEINIPGIANQEQFNTFDVELFVPKSFGPTAYVKPCTPHPNLLPRITPSPEGEGRGEGGQCKSPLKFTKEQLGKSGISIGFGDKQNYSYILTYHLRNQNLFPIRTEIALPPNTNYQEVFIDSLSPEPIQVYKDKDGNWLAQYTLLSSQRLDVQAKGTAVLSLYPKKELLSDAELKPYLQEQPYWQLSNEKIKSLASDLKSPEDVYNYVIKTLSYDFSRVTDGKPRIGAVGVIKNPKSAVCLEFTDLFIALARAAGIPARELDGFAFTENPKQRPLSLVQDILHAWPEYYDRERQAWVMVDPTWGNTTGGVDYFHTLDFDHVVFVKKGISSTYPIPAGGYKISGDEDKKDVSIAFDSSQDNTRQGNLQIQPIIADTFTAGLLVNGTVTVINKGSRVSVEQQMHISSQTLTPHQQYKQVSGLLPFEHTEIAFQFDQQPFLTNKTHTIRIGFDCFSNATPLPTLLPKGEGTLVTPSPEGEGWGEGKCVTKTIKVVPIYIKEWNVLGGVSFALFASIICIIAIKTRRIRIF